MSEQIRQWKPWEKSTGPKSESGKHKASQNSYKHGMRSAETIELKKIMTEMAKIERDARKLA